MLFKHYRFDTIRQMADDVRSSYCKDPNKIPIDVERIIEFGLGIEIRPIPNLKSSLDIDGFLSNDLKVIFVDGGTFSEPRFQSRMRFTLAHELGHFFLHKDFYGSVNFQSPQQWYQLIHDIDEGELSWYEAHANDFAGRLLVPRELLIAEIDQHKSQLETLTDMARKKGFEDNEEIFSYKQAFIASKLAPKFLVSSKTMEIRIKKEYIKL